MTKRTMLEMRKREEIQDLVEDLKGDACSGHYSEKQQARHSGAAKMGLWILGEISTEDLLSSLKELHR